jgi:hypothetical protein
MTAAKGLTLFLLLALASSLLADYRPIERGKTGSIEGYVRFPGETPPPFMFLNPQDHDCPHGIGQNHLNVEQTSLALQNAVVILEAHEGDAKAIRPASVVTRGCVLQPRVQVVAQNTNMLFQNSDGARHRLRASINDATRFNVDLLVSSATMRRPLVDIGFYRIDCDRHPWERAWIYSSAHPYATLSDAEGHFLIENIPPGRYLLRAWHEGWIPKNDDNPKRPDFRPVEQTLEVVVRSKRTVSVTFDQLQTPAVQE